MSLMDSIYHREVRITAPKFKVGQFVQYFTNADPSNLRTGRGKIERIYIDRYGNIYYYIRSRYRLESELLCAGVYNERDNNR